VIKYHKWSHLQNFHKPKANRDVIQFKLQNLVARATQDDDTRDVIQFKLQNLVARATQDDDTRL
jgi:hypothetical protein